MEQTVDNPRRRKITIKTQEIMLEKSMVIEA